MSYILNVEVIFSQFPSSQRQGGHPCMGVKLVLQLLAPADVVFTGDDNLTDSTHRSHLSEVFVGRLWWIDDHIPE